MAAKISHLELVDADKKVLARLGEEVRDELVDSLRGDSGGLSATTPPWAGYYVVVHVEGREEPFIATLVGMGTLRLNARDPYDARVADAQGELDLENVSDVGLSDLLFEAVYTTLGSPTAKEYQTRPPPPP